MSIKSKYKASKIGTIPSDWEVMTLGEIGETLNGLTYSPKNINEDGVLVLRSSNVQNRKIELQDNVFVNVDVDDYNPVKENDLLICVRNGSRSLIGKNALVKKEHEGLAFGAFMSIFRSEDNSYLYQLFDTDFYNREIHRNLGATINSINGGNLKRFKFPFPPKEERDSITKILSQWDEAIETTQNLITQLQLRKKGLMQELLSGKKRLAGYDEKWVQRKLSYYLKSSRDKNSNAVYNKNDVLSVSGEFGIVNQIEFQGRSFAGASVLNYGIVNNGDVVYTKSPLKANPYGIIKVNKGKAGIVSTLYAVYKCKETLDGTFIDYYFQLDDNLNKYLRPLVQKGTKNDMKINNEKVLIDPVCFPKLEEQRALSSFFMNIDNEIQTSMNYLENLKMQKKGLMKQLLTGQKRVKI